MTTAREAIKHILDNYEMDEVIAVAIWCAVDVIERAKERKIKLTLEQAEAILDRIDRKQDATLGITWLTLDVFTDDFLDDQKEKETTGEEAEADSVSKAVSKGEEKLEKATEALFPKRDDE